MDTYQSDNIDDIFLEHCNNDTTIVCDECTHDLINYEGSMICKKCCISLNGTPTIGNYPIYRYLGYQRKFYFKDKLRLIIRRKQCTKKVYIEVLDQLKISFKPHYKDDLRNFKLFRKKVKKINRKMTKYIYSLYYDCVGKELIKIDDKQYNKIVSDFIKFNITFTEMYPEKTNIFNYNIILYLLLAHNNIPSYKYILLPKNYEHTITKYNKCFSE